VVALWEVGFQGADWRLFALAVVAALLAHIDAHIWNDLMDVEVDRHEKSREKKAKQAPRSRVGHGRRLQEDLCNYHVPGGGPCRVPDDAAGRWASKHISLMSASI
jgi:hypothetical protein